MNKINLIKLLAWVGITIFINVLFADTKIASLESVFEKFNKTNTPGIAVLVVKNGETLFKKGYGNRNIESPALITENTAFRLASVSKHITALAIAQLEKEKKLNSDDTILKYFPEFPKSYKSVKIEHLVHHSSGLPDYMRLCSKSDRSLIVTNERVIAFLADKENKLNFIPGTKFEYSNSGYVVLATLVSKVTGMTFKDYLKKQFFVEAGLEKVNVADYPMPSIQENSSSYGVWPYFENLDFDTCNYIVGDGGIFFTMNNFETWIKYLENTVFKDDYLKGKIFSSYSLSDGQKIPYGYGWSLGEIGGLKAYSHSGSWLGYRTFMSYFPNENLWIVLMANYTDTLKQPFQLLLHHYTNPKP